MGNLIIAINDFKTDIIQCVNKAADNGVPFTVIEPIVQDIVIQIQNAAKVELDRAKNAQKTEVKTDEDNVT